MFSQAPLGESGGVWNQGPRIALGLSLIQYIRKAVEEGFAVPIVLEDFPSFNSPGLPAIASLLTLTFSGNILDDFSKIASRTPL